MSKGVVYTFEEAITHIVLHNDISGNTTAATYDELNNLTNPTKYQPYQIEWSGEVLYRVVTIIVVMFLTLVGNTTLILIITCHPAERRKRVNIFLFNLALGDLMVCFFTMTSEILFVAFGEWVLGAVACKLIVYGQMVTLASAVFLLVAMSIDRYQVLVQPLKSLAGNPRIWKKVAIAWGLAFTFTIPQLFIFVQTDNGYHVDGSVKHLCKSQGYTAKWQRKVYFTFLATYILVIPTIIMSFCYINIIRVVWRRTESETEAGGASVSFRAHVRDTSPCISVAPNNPSSRRLVSSVGAKQNQKNRLRLPKKLINSSKRNVVKMTLCVIIGFLICWTPYFVVSLCRIYSDYKLKLGIGLAVAEVMALVHSALNPILYVIFCTKHAKAALYRMTRCLHPKSRIDHMDETISDEETTFIENRKYSINTHLEKRNFCSCCPYWRSCFKKSGKSKSHNMTVTFYHELVPNGYKTNDSTPERTNSGRRLDAASERDLFEYDGGYANNEPFNKSNNSRCKNQRKRDCTYSISNSNYKPRQDCVTPV